MVSVPVVLAYSCSLFHQSSSLNSPCHFLHLVPIPELDDEVEDDEDAGDDNKKKGALTPSKRRVSGAGGSTQRSCQAEDCTADMADAKPYHRRHKVCDFHAKAAVVVLSGSRQRFCQQCSRFDS